MGRVGEKAAANGGSDGSPAGGIFRCLQLVNKLTVGLVGLATALSTASSLLTDWPVGPIARVVVGVVVATVLGFHLLNFETRVILGHWEIEEIHKSLRAELAMGCVVPGWVLCAVIDSAPHWELFVAVFLGLILAFAFYEPVQETIRAAVERRGYPQGTTYFGSMQPFLLLGIEDDIQTIATGEHFPNLQSFLAFFVGDPWLPGFSRTRTVILCLLLFALVTSLAGAAEVGLQEAVHPHGDGATQDQSQAVQVRSPGSSTAEGDAASQAGEVAQTPEDERGCRVMPGHGAPGWARADLNALYVGGIDLNATAPPGFQAGGCSDGAVAPPRAHGAFVYSIGRAPDGAILSLAVDSFRFGPGIFLAPAAQRVLALIEAGQMPVGGYPRVEAGGGDVVPVLTPLGTVVLTRASTHLPGRTRYASPYVELAPAVAAAWLGAMNEAGSWLWPVGPRLEGAGVAFDLRRGSPHGQKAFEIATDLATGIARRGSYAYQLPQPQLSQAELERWAEEAG